MKRALNLTKFALVLLLTSSPFFSQVASGGGSALVICKSLLAPTEGFNVNWTPYSKGAKVPEVLKDPYVQFALSNDKFREYLIDEMKQGRGKITDFKQVADGEPLYSEHFGPQLPLSPNSNQQVRASDLPFPQLVEYILRNYQLGQSGGAVKAQLTPEERLIQSPFEGAAKNEPLILKAARALHSTWEELLRETTSKSRGSLLWLPKRYIVAGGRFREAYYWDSLWIIKGLIGSGYKDIALGMLENLVHQFEEYGIIPNGNRFYYLTRTQLPVFIEMADVLSKNGLLNFRNAKTKPKSLESRVLNVGREYYRKIWRGTQRYRPELGLFAYSDGAGGHGDPNKVVIRPESDIKEPRSTEKHSQRVFAELGWDMSYTRFGKSPQDWLPVDLNATLVGYTAKLSRMFKEAGQNQAAALFQREAQRIQGRIKAQLYDKKMGLYVDYNFVTDHLSETLTAASFFPFYFEVHDKSEASRGALKFLFRSLKPVGHFGVHSTNKDGLGQWDGSWTWAPLNEIAFQSLLKFGLIQEAQELALDYSAMVIASYFINGHKFKEKYRAEDGSIRIPENSEIYGNEDGFGWTNGTLIVFLAALKDWGLLPTLEKKISRLLHRE